MTDYIMLPRAWLETAITSQPDFLSAAVYLAKEINEHGSVKFSSGDANMMFGMSPRRYRTFMQIIANDKQTDKQATNKTTNITFECQVVTSTKRQTRRQTRRQTNDKQTDKQKPTKFTPPTDEEVRQYVTEKGNHFNPDQFVPHSQSKGWMIGKNPMKDWKAACRTWELEWQKKHGEQFYYQLAIPSAVRDTPAARKEQRDRSLSLANEIVSQSADLYNLYDGIIPESVDR